MRRLLKSVSAIFVLFIAAFYIGCTQKELDDFLAALEEQNQSGQQQPVQQDSYNSQYNAPVQNPLANNNAVQNPLGNNSSVQNPLGNNNSVQNPLAGNQAIQSQVVINGIALNNNQLMEIQRIYRIKPKPGRYWYDSKSGLYGVVGYPAYGFMLPNHNFGQMNRKASNGNTGVIINGRELPQAEWMIWSQTIGYYIRPGNYWLDHRGNAGNVGNPYPTVNLYVAAQQNAARRGGYGGQSGGGGGGDNFWSTRFSAGNSNADNTQGYVSVPGYGPVGYGF